MQEGKTGRKGFVFWGIIVSGFMLPSVVMVALGMILNPAQLLHILKPLQKLLLEQAIIGVINSIPFIALALLAKKELRGDTKLEFLRKPYPQKWGLVGAAVGAIGSSFFLNVFYWADLFGPSPSSTGSLVFVFLPFYGCMLLLFGYVCGLGISSFLTSKGCNK